MQINHKNIIYLDNNATTKTDPLVIQEMLPYFSEYYGNASSNTHILSWQSESAVDKATQQIAALINANPFEIIYTSGATESNNLIFKGLSLTEQDHIIVSNIEHKCVLESAKYQHSHYKVALSFLKVDENGHINLDELKNLIQPNTKLISIMLTNNEIHTINPIKEIGIICKEFDLLLHVDAAQGMGKIPIDVKELNVDLLSASGHKFYAPKGVGFLYIKGGINKTTLKPLFLGGNQEKGLRSGTLPVPLIAGLGKAAELAKDMFIQQPEKLKGIEHLTQLIFTSIKNEFNEIRLNGSDLKYRHLGGLNVSFPNIDAGELQFLIPHICFSRGSACSSASLDYSYVLKAIGVPAELAIGTMRICLSKYTTQEEIEIASMDIISAIKKLYRAKLFSNPFYSLSN